MKGDPFTCDGCHRTFTKAWSDEEAKAEYDRVFPNEKPDEPRAMLCTSCYQRLLQLMN